MAESETIFSSKISYKGVFSFKDFYQFCYDWLTQEPEFKIAEGKYSEKIAGDSKNIDVEWGGKKDVTDYFQYKIKVVFKITELKDIEINQEGIKIKTNTGKVDLSIKGDLFRDYKGKFERGASRKFMRAIYEKWVIPSRIEQYEDKLISKCDEFLGQAKAWLDLEGKR